MLNFLLEIMAFVVWFAFSSIFSVHPDDQYMLSTGFCEPMALEFRKRFDTFCLFHKAQRLTHHPYALLAANIIIQMWWQCKTFQLKFQNKCGINFFVSSFLILLQHSFLGYQKPFYNMLRSNDTASLCSNINITLFSLYSLKFDAGQFLFVFFLKSYKCARCLLWPNCRKWKWFLFGLRN